MTETVQPNTVNPLIEELEQAIADTLNVAIPAFSQLGMVALLSGFQNLINHHAAVATVAKGNKLSPNPAPILQPVPPNPAPVSVVG